MLFILTLFLMIVSIAILLLDDYIGWKHWIVPFVSLGVAAISIIAAFVMTTVLIIGNISIRTNIPAMRVRYESLVYQYENNLYENDNDVGKKELMDQIQEWNEEIANGKTYQRDFWVGIFVPNVYDEFDFIEVESHGD